MHMTLQLTEYNFLQGNEVFRINQFTKLVRKPSEDADDESDKLAGKGYYWSREKSERWQLFITRLRTRNERIRKENAKYKERINKEHEEEQARLFDRAKANLLKSRQQQSIPPHFHIHYQTLGLPVGEDMKFVKAKYFQLAKMYHPDKHLNSPDILKKQVEEYFKRISIAYNSLTQISPGQMI